MTITEEDNKEIRKLSVQLEKKEAQLMSEVETLRTMRKRVNGIYEEEIIIEENGKDKKVKRSILDSLTGKEMSEDMRENLFKIYKSDVATLIK